MMFAVIKAKGYQYVVSKGETITIPAFIGEVNKEVLFDEILMIKDNGSTEVGHPYVKGAAVKGVIREKGKLPKVIVYKFKRRLKYRKKQGHRQNYSKIEIIDIVRK
jgi:large subunit ribosomal protein L21